MPLNLRLVDEWKAYFLLPEDKRAAGLIRFRVIVAELLSVLWRSTTPKSVQEAIRAEFREFGAAVRAEVAQMEAEPRPHVDPCACEDCCRGARFDRPVQRQAKEQS